MKLSRRLAVFDATLMGITISVLLWIAGLGAIVISWRGLAAERVVAFQLPLAVSGGVGGLALVAVAAVVVSVDLRRRETARRRDLLDDLSAALIDLAAAARATQRGTPR